MDNSPFQEDLPIQLDHFPGSQQQEKTTNPPQEVALTHTHWYYVHAYVAEDIHMIYVNHVATMIMYMIVYIYIYK